MKVCDGKSDCIDGSDEKNCNNTERIYQVTHIGADERTINETSFLIYWWIPVPQHVVFEFLPSISLAGTNSWNNQTSWVDGTEHRFLNLRSYTNYNVTVYVRIKGKDTIFIPYLYANATTLEGVPSAPLNVSVTQVNGSRVRVVWRPPTSPSGVLISYTVYYRKQTQLMTQAASQKVSAEDTSVLIEAEFEGNATYQFWVKAKNSRHESPYSEMVRLQFDDLSNIDSITGLKAVMTNNKTNDSSVLKIMWNPIKTAEGYVVQPLLPHLYPRVEAIKTNVSNIVISDLVPGTQYLFKVSAYVKKYHGRSSAVVVPSNGNPLPVIPLAGIYHDVNVIRLRWEAPNIDLGKPLEYGIYYGTSMEELLERKYIKLHKYKIFEIFFSL